MDLKTTQNLETAHKGKPGTSFNVLENSYLHDISSKVNITLGTNDHDAFQNIDALKNAEKDKCDTFIDANPETVLPSNLDLNHGETQLKGNAMPSEHNDNQSSPKETWSLVVHRGLKPPSQTNIPQERCLLEH